MQKHLVECVSQMKWLVATGAWGSWKTIFLIGDGEGMVGSCNLDAMAADSEEKGELGR